MSVHFFREKFPQTADLKHIKETVTKSKPDVLMSIRISIRTLISIYQTHLNDKHVAIQSNSNTHPLHCSTYFPILKMKARAHAAQAWRVWDSLLPGCLHFMRQKFIAQNNDNKSLSHFSYFVI